MCTSYYNPHASCYNYIWNNQTEVQRSWTIYQGLHVTSFVDLIFFFCISLPPQALLRGEDVMRKSPLEGLENNCRVIYGISLIEKRDQTSKVYIS